MNEKKDINPLFFNLVVSLTNAAWQSLGKIPNPVTNKIEKNIENASVSIDILEMLKDKMKGNLTQDETRILEDALTDLKLNYVDEVKKAAEKNNQKS